ncbi:hypothetical protein DPMN_096160 [Dreissena polymorpha]|uniref:Receptor ligand binding region domain-containing protein n=1 Tax=Dreissena polymorpha TaxID=45954 RepID=A0A9D4L982_DREPO|nr:hypothetical protein DPMN_096160 [Dreissena polymorpha]
MLFMLGVTLILFTGVVTGYIEILSGDFYIEGVFTLYAGQGDEPCARLVPRSVQHLEAVRYRIQQTSTIKIGLRVHATCGNVSRAQEIAYNISQMLGDPYSKSIAVIGPESNEDTEVVSRLLSALPPSFRPMQISFSADSNVFDNREIYKNFFRVIPTEMAKSKAIVEFMSGMLWTYMAIIHDNTTHSVSMVANIQSLHGDDGRYICFPHVLSRPADTSRDITEDLEEILFGVKSTRGLIIIGDTNLISSVMAGLEKFEFNTTDNNYMRPVIIAVENEPFSVPDIAPAYNASKGMYAISPSILTNTAFHKHWNVSLTNTNLSGNWFVRKLAEQKEDNNTSNAHLFDITQLSIYSTYAQISVDVILKSMSQLCQVSSQCTGLDTAQLSTTASRLSYVSTIGNMLISFGPNIPNAQLTMSNALATFYDLDVLNNIRKSETSAFGFEKIFQISSYGGNVLSTNRIHQYYRNGTEQSYPTFLKPQCPDGRKCTECRQIAPLPIDVTKGDLYIVGIVPVHTVLNDVLACGSVKQGGLDVAESIKAAVKEAKLSYSDKIPDASIGVIIIDSCNSRQIVAARLLQLLNQGIYEDGKFTEVRSKIIGYIGGWVSDNSIMVASILTQIKSVQISYGSTSPVLSDRTLYPYFMRMIPNDLHQGSKMIELVKSTGSDLIQILYSDTAYGRGGKDALVEHADKNGVCVAQIVKVEQKTNIDLEMIRTQLTQKGLPKLVLVFLSSFDVVKVIEILKQLQGYTFIASEDWGNRDILANGENLVGSITLANEIPIPDYLKKHIEDASKQKQKQQWLLEYMEDYFDCYYEWRFDKTTHRKPCSVDQYLQPCLRATDTCFKIDTWSPFAAIGVETLLKGAKETLHHLCNGNTSTICKAYLEKPETLINNIKNQQVAYNLRSLKPIFHNTTHDGLIDFVTYRVTQDSKGLFYEEIETPKDFPKSTCSENFHESCNTCFAKMSEKPDENGSGTRENKSYVIAMGVFIGITVALVAALVASICYYRRSKGSNDTYLTPFVDDPGYLRPTEIMHRSVDGIDQSSQMGGDSSGISGCSVNKMTDDSQSDHTAGRILAKPCPGNATVTPTPVSTEQPAEILPSNNCCEFLRSDSELPVPLNNLNFGNIPPIPKQQTKNLYV